MKGNRKYFHDVDLTVMPGENVTLSSRTGAGKVQFSSFAGVVPPWNPAA